MRIAQLCFQRYPSPRDLGGGDVRLWQSLCSLRALGHDLDLVVCDLRNERTSELDVCRRSVHTVCASRSEAEFLRGLARGSRAVCERHFTMEALYPKYEQILDIALNPNAEPVSCAS